MEVPRYLLFIGMMLIFGAIMAEATNYVIINRFAASNATNASTQAEYIIPGTFGAAVLNGTYIFPADLYVDGVLYVNGTDILARLIADNNTQAVMIQAIDGSLATLYTRESSNNVTQANEMSSLQGQINSKGNVSSTGSSPYLPYFATSTLLGNSPIYRDTANRVTVNGTMNVTGLDENTTFEGDVKIIGRLYGGSPVKIAGGLDVLSGNSNFGDIFVNSCQGCGVFTYNGTANYSGINATNVTVQNIVVLNSIVVPNQSIPQSAIINLTFPNQTIYNESGITRNLSYLLGVAGPSITIPLPNQLETTVTVSVTGTSQPTSLMLTFNGDLGNNYMYRRIQGYTWLYQGITIVPRTNITMEGYQYNGQRSIEIKVSRAPTGTVGSFQVVSGDNISVTPYTTLGNFDWTNSTATTLTIQAAQGNINSGSYIIVKSEGL
jgi:hypothetical protein